MLNNSRWQLTLVVVFLTLAIICYGLEYTLFQDADAVIQSILEESGFTFLSVILVSLIIDRVLVFREKASQMKKLNMVIGSFFSEVGTELLLLIADFDANMPQLSQQLVITAEWTQKDFSRVQEYLKNHQADISVPEGNLETLRSLLHNYRQFLLSLLQNPNLMEHESFTDLLWALFHLTEELVNRRELDKLSQEDNKHISGDIARTYKSLISEWLDYMSHLKHDYPYLFSFEIRTNPFNPNARVEFNGSLKPGSQPQGSQPPNQSAY